MNCYTYWKNIYIYICKFKNFSKLKIDPSAINLDPSSEVI